MIRTTAAVWHAKARPKSEAEKQIPHAVRKGADGFGMTTLFVGGAAKKGRS